MHFQHVFEQKHFKEVYPNSNFEKIQIHKDILEINKDAKQIDKIL